MKYDTQHRNDQKRANAQSHGINQHRTVHHGTDLSRQNLQIRFCHGDQHTQHKANSQQKKQLSLLGQTGAHVGSHRSHGQICAKIKKSNANDQQHCTHCKRDQFCATQVKPGSQCH